MKNRSLKTFLMILVCAVTVSCGGKKNEVREDAADKHNYLVVVSWKYNNGKPVDNNGFALAFYTNDENCMLQQEGGNGIKNKDVIDVKGKSDAIFRTSKPVDAMAVRLFCGKTDNFATLYLYVYRDDNTSPEALRMAKTFFWNPQKDRLLIDVNDPARN